jgi:quinol monooxygenase YgiN
MAGCCGPAASGGSWSAGTSLIAEDPNPARRQRSHPVIFIVVKFTIRPEKADQWLSLVDDFTQATRAEPGNIFFEWSRRVDVPNQFVLVEAFADGAGEAHVNSDHFKSAMTWMPQVIATKPEIINVHVPQDGWGEMGEVTPIDPQ